MSTSEVTATDKRDVYARVTAQIINAIEQGALTLNFKRATDALLLAATFVVDWTQDTDALGSNPEFRRAGYGLHAAFSSGFERHPAERRLAELERAA